MCGLFVGFLGCSEIKTVKLLPHLKRCGLISDIKKLKKKDKGYNMKKMFKEVEETKGLIMNKCEIIIIKS